MAYAASRYTEAKLAPICQELFRDLDQDAVDFVDNYANTGPVDLLQCGLIVNQLPAGGEVRPQ